MMKWYDVKADDVQSEKGPCAERKWNISCRRPPQGSSPIAGGGHEAFRQRAPPALHSRRGRDLWSIVHRRLTAVVRLRAAMRNS